MVLVQVGGVSTKGKNYKQCLAMIKSGGRPLTMTFQPGGVAFFGPAAMAMSASAAAALSRTGSDDRNNTLSPPLRRRDSLALSARAADAATKQAAAAAAAAASEHGGKKGRKRGGGNKKGSANDYYGDAKMRSSQDGSRSPIKAANHGDLMVLVQVHHA